MKKIILPLVAAFVLTGCSTYQYTARTLGVDRQTVGTKEIAVEIVPDYGKVVTATSDFQLTKNDAMKEAEHRCLMDNDIDVIIDPIFKIVREPLQPQKKYKATVTGFAGKYKQTKAFVDAVKEYEKEDIEKYKLLYDPDFAKYYYNHGTGDIYYINSSAPSVKKESDMKPMAFAPKMQKRPVREFDFLKSKRMRNAGIGLTVAGVLSTFAIGLPCYFTAVNSVEYYYTGYGSYYYYDQSALDAGVAFMVMGSAAVVAGIPMWCIGSKRMKNADRDLNVSMGGTQSGIGLRFNF